MGSFFDMMGDFVYFTPLFDIDHDDEVDAQTQTEQRDTSNFIEANFEVVEEELVMIGGSINE